MDDRRQPLTALTCLCLWASGALSLSPTWMMGASTQPSTPVASPSSQTIIVPESPIEIDDATPQQQAWLQQLQPRTHQFEAVLTQTADTEDDWRLTRITFASPVVTPWPENNTVPCELYLPKTQTAEPLRAVIVLDILHGSAIIPRGIARGMAQKGVAAMYVPMACYGPRRPPNKAHEQYYFDHPEKTVDNLRQTVMDVRRGKAVLAALPQVDAKHISITGVSLGGIVTSLVAGVDGSFDRVIPILAGGDIASICFHARETRKIREACNAKGITEEALRQMLRPVEPLSFASRIDSARCLMVNATLDEVIPPDRTADLAQAIGTPHLIKLTATHYSAVMFLPTIRTRLVDFLKGKTTP